MKLIDILDGTPLPIGYRIAFLTAFFREPLLRRIERDHGLIRPEWTVLVCLAFRSGLNARDICEVTEQPSNSVSRGVSSLLAKGLIARRPDPEDARRSLLSLTHAGRAAHDAGMALFRQAEDAMTASLDPAERTMLIRLLDKMARDVPRWKTCPPYNEAPHG
ncbi:MarR family winged helix-turn-helix transcriptional regulator [Roseovarius aquimarinus]|uniref:MarR family winged helix-turn-helix transcriptional regulator n=1 Tax=Roseovarius aquimarinus TaxID=1229156 RepID=A0ABW7I8Y0_9RHOB